MFRLSWHFGRTQHFTSIGSHNIDGDENSENKDHYSQTIPWLDQQARHFKDSQYGQLRYSMFLVHIIVYEYKLSKSIVNNTLICTEIIDIITHHD